MADPTTCPNCGEELEFDMEDEDQVAQVNMIRSRRAEARQRLLTPPDLTAANDAAPAKKSALKAPVRRRA